MFYAVRHTTTFRYSAPITESITEVRMQPRTEDRQRCHSFNLSITPRARVLAYRDDLGNTVHHFDIPRAHRELDIVAEAVVEITPAPLLPVALDQSAWAELDQLAASGEYWEWLAPSFFAQPTDLLRAFARELGAERRADPLNVLREINSAIFDAFEYAPASTAVDSPIDDALQARQGVCQDYAHIMTALVRGMGIPCRYVSGYLFHRTDHTERSAQDATHAWVEAYLPSLGWIGFDPTNNLVVDHRHVRAAIGRDYADVPPTRGVFKGSASSELKVAVSVTLTDPPRNEELPLPTWSPFEGNLQMQMQQQQQ